VDSQLVIWCEKCKNYSLVFDSIVYPEANVIGKLVYKCRTKKCERLWRVMTEDPDNHPLLHSDLSYQIVSQFVGGLPFRLCSEEPSGTETGQVARAVATLPHNLQQAETIMRTTRPTRNMNERAARAREAIPQPIAPLEFGTAWMDETEEARSEPAVYDTARGTLR